MLLKLPYRRKNCSECFYIVIRVITKGVSLDPLSPVFYFISILREKQTKPISLFPRVPSCLQFQNDSNFNGVICFPILEKQYPIFPKPSLQIRDDCVMTDYHIMNTVTPLKSPHRRDPPVKDRSIKMGHAKKLNPLFKQIYGGPSQGY